MAAKRTAPKATGSPLGEPSGRLAELFAKTVVPQPYKVSDRIIVQPLSKSAIGRLNELQNQRMVGNFFLAEALKRQGDEAPTDADLAELTRIITDADDAYNRLFFGPAHDDVMAFFSDRPQAYWSAFCTDIRAQFLPSEPATGACPHCGSVVDEDLVGKDSAPST